MTTSTVVRPVSTVRIGVARIRLEVLMFFRNRQAAVFTFMFPVMLLLLFATIFHGRIGTTGVDFRQYFLAGITASGMISNSFNNLAIGMAVERHTGMFKRLSGTPMPKAAFFIGKMGLTFVTTIVQTVLMLTFGVVLYGLHLPVGAARWGVFLYVLFVGNIACSLLGIAYSRLPKQANTAAAYVTPPYLFLQFISGIFFVISDLPKGLQLIASVFPMRWMASLLRYAFLPGSFGVNEPGHGWRVGTGMAVIAGWMIVSFLLCVRSFRFNDDL